MPLSRPYDPTCEVEEGARIAVQGPVVPADFVVLGVGVVVASLSAIDLVAAKEHGDALGEHQRGKEVALLLMPQGIDLRVVRLTLDAAIPAQILIPSITVGFAVRQVALACVGDEVMQSEAVVGGDEVDAGLGLALVPGVDVA